MNYKKFKQENRYQFIKHNKFLVLKIEDCDNYLTAYKQNELALICETIRRERMKNNKPINSYIIVNQDEPYANSVWELIKNHEVKSR
uniref:Uncharacterized protein n=1 Tax=viral metagenome TaxID=1070528 RepID=A0A6M3K6R8_9ZZZZ